MARLPVLAWIRDELRYRMAPERLLENPYAAAKSLGPPRGADGLHVMPAFERESGEPVPPRELWEGYGVDADQYLALGREHMARLVQILGDAGADPARFRRVLDFGCAAARMLRFFPRTAPELELWGVDLKPEHIAWSQRKLGLPFRFAQTTTFPHLPFEDGSFDLVYAASVFTHIDELVDAWLLELRRILAPGAYLYLTIADHHTIELLLAATPGDLAWSAPLPDFVAALRELDRATGILSSEIHGFSFAKGSWGGLPVPRVFYDRARFVERLASVLEPCSATEGAHTFQTALLFRKREAGGSR